MGAFTTRVQTRSLPFLRIYNAIVYALSACIYLAILVGLELHSPGLHIFFPNAPHRNPFMSLSIITFALLASSALVLLVLYYPSRAPRPASRRFPEVTLASLAVITLSFLAILVGLVATACAAALIFLGQRDRYRAFESEQDSLRSWAIPVLTGIIPGVFFALMALGLLHAIVCAMRAVGEVSTASRKAASAASELSNGGSTVWEASGSESENYGAPLTSDQEASVSRLVEMGYLNRSANVAALQASCFDFDEAQRRLHGAQVEV